MGWFVFCGANGNNREPSSLSLSKAASSLVQRRVTVTIPAVQEVSHPCYVPQDLGHGPLPHLAVQFRSISIYLGYAPLRAHLPLDHTVLQRSHRASSEKKKVVASSSITLSKVDNSNTSRTLVLQRSRIRLPGQSFRERYNSSAAQTFSTLHIHHITC